MCRGIWGQSLLIDKDSRVDIRMTDYDTIFKLVPKERVKDTQTSFWLKDEFSYGKSSLNVSSKKKKKLYGFFPTDSGPFASFYSMDPLWLNTQHPLWECSTAFLATKAARGFLVSVTITQEFRTLFSTIFTSSFTIPVMCFSKGWYSVHLSIYSTHTRI